MQYLDQDFYLFHIPCTRIYVGNPPPPPKKSWRLQTPNMKLYLELFCSSDYEQLRYIDFIYMFILRCKRPWNVHSMPTGCYKVSHHCVKNCQFNCQLNSALMYVLLITFVIPTPTTKTLTLEPIFILFKFTDVLNKIYVKFRLTVTNLPYTLPIHVTGATRMTRAVESRRERIRVTQLLRS
jgi:hypothetical protein